MYVCCRPLLSTYNRTLFESVLQSSSLVVGQPFASALFHFDQKHRQTIENRGTSDDPVLSHNTWWAVVSAATEFQPSQMAEADRKSAAAMQERVNATFSEADNPLPLSMLLGFILVQGPCSIKQLSEDEREWVLGYLCRTVSSKQWFA